MPRTTTLSRDAVLQCALEMAQQNGLDAVGYNGLARELGIRPQSMYRYVSNITDLRLLMIRTLLDELVAEIGEAIEGFEPREALRSFAIALYDACHARPLYYQALTLMHEYGLVEDLREQLTGLVGLTSESFAALDPDPATAARHQQLFMAINLGYAQMSMTEFLPPSLRDDRTAFAVSIEQAVLMFCEA